jgi:zinc protease
MKKIVLLLFVLVSAIETYAQNLKIPIPNNPNVKVGTLKNGMKYYILKNQEPKNRMELRLVVNVGSIQETDSQQGLAHFMEHMNFNGTKNFPKNDIVSFLQKSGMKFGADLNATTGLEETVYQLLVPTDSVQLFDKSFQILADWASGATLDTVEINKERGVVLEEERLRGKNAQARISEKTMPILFNNSIHSQRLPIGKTEIIKNFKYEELTKFYKDWYRPDLMAVVAVGDFEVEKVEALINQKFNSIQKVKNPLKKQISDVQLTGGARSSVIVDKEFPQTVFQTVIRLPRERTLTQADVRTDILESLYVQMLNLRLQEITKKPNPPFLFGTIFYVPMLTNMDLFQAICLPKNPESLETAIKALFDEQNRVKNFGFTAGELERAKKEYFLGVEKSYKEKDKTKSASLVGGLVSNFLRGSSYPSVDFTYEFTKAQLDGISLDEVKNISNKLLKFEDQVGIVISSEKSKDKLPSESRIIELMAYKNPDLKPYEDVVANSAILEKIPAGSKIVSEKKINEVDITELTFENGVKVALKPTKFQNDQILFSGSSFGGTSLYSDKDFYSAQTASNIVSIGGVNKLSDVQLEKALSGKIAQVSVYVKELSEGIEGTTTPKDLETALQLMYAKVTQPRRDDELIKSQIKSMKELTENMVKTLTPEQVFSDSITTYLFKNHYRRQPSKPEVFDKINIDRAIEIYKERFADFSDFTFSFVGNFDVEKIKPLLEKYIGGLPSTKRKESFNDLGINKVEGLIEKTIFKGLEDKASVNIQFNGNFSYTDEELTGIRALAEVIDIRLIEKLREEESGIYSPSIDFDYSKFPNPNYNISISFGCAPANVDKLIKVTMTEIEKIKQNGPVKEETEKVIAEQKRSAELMIKDNNFWNSYILGQYSDGRDLNYINKYITQLIDTISTSSVQKAANQFLGKNVAKFVLLPEKK